MHYLKTYSKLASFFLALFIIFNFILPVAYSQNEQPIPMASESSNKIQEEQNEEDRNDVSKKEKENDVDKEKIIKDISKMTTQQVIKYAIDLFTIPKKPYSAIFALEYYLNHTKETLEKVNSVYNVLGSYYAAIGEKEKSVENFSIYFKNREYPNGIPDTPDGIKKYKCDETYYLLYELYVNQDIKVIWDHMVKLSNEIIDNCPLASKEAVRLADIVLTREEKMIAQDALEKKRLKILQGFMDELALLIEKHDSEGIYKLYRKHTFSDKSAKGYLDVIEKYYWGNNIKKVHFEVTDVSCYEHYNTCWWSYHYITIPDLYPLIKKELPMKEWINLVHFKYDSFYFK